MAQLNLQLFGQFRISHEAESEIAAPGKKGQALLGYLALAPDQSHTRDRLTTLLWGDRLEDQARQSLRQCLLTLRKTLGDEETPILVSDGDRLVLNHQAVEVDVLLFEQLAKEDTREQLERAVDLYRGDLLEGLDVRSEEFDEWLAGERNRLRDLAVDSLGQLMTLRAEADEAESAIDAAQQLLALDPLREDAHRLLMRLYDDAGRRSAALRQYQSCEEVLRRELDVEPAPETRQLISEIRTRQEGTGQVATDAGVATTQVRLSKGRPRLWAVVAVGLLLIGAGGALWYSYLRGPQSLTEIAQVADMAFPLPEKPSIAVLPFLNLSGDPVQDQFIDGITEDITTALSIISEMFVIARTTALFYKDKPVNVVQVAEELGVRYVLEGSVQQSGDRVRVTAQLIDAVGGHHVWAEQYDREIQDIFAVQDDITLEIVTALRVQIAEGEQERVALIHGTRNLQAWLLGSQGTQRARQLTREDNSLARSFFERAARLDPKYPGAWDGQAWTHLIDAKFGWSESGETSIYRAAALAQKALELDPARSRTYGLLGTIQLLSGNHAQAVALGENAVALDPNGAEVAAFLAVTLTYTGELDRSIALIDRAMRLSPYYPDWYRWNLGRAYRLMGRYEDAIAALEIRLAENPGALVPRIELAATYSSLGRQAEARAMVAEVLKIHPGFSVRQWMRAPPYKDPAVMTREFGTLRKAGLPE